MNHDDEFYRKTAAAIARESADAARAAGRRPRNPRLAVVPPSPARDESREVPSPQHPMAVARELVKHLFTGQDGLVLRNHRGDFFQWTGTHWPEVDQRDIRAAAYAFLEHATFVHPDEGRKPFAPTRRKIDDVVDALRAIVFLDSQSEAPTWITPTPTLPPARELISMTNGLLHVPSRTLLPQTPNYFVHHALPFAFDATAPAPARWLRFLDELWPDDGSSILALQETFGYIVAGDTRQQKIFLLNGPKRGGKGTIGRVLTGLLGVHNVAAPTLASLSTNFGLSPLIGKPLALVSDARLSTKADSKIVVERLLSVSGEDSLTIDRKYREPWTGRLPSRFMILTNELPRLTDASGALASRFVVFVLTRSFYRQEDPTLTEALLSEVSGIFTWALAGLDRLTARGYFVTPASGREAVQQLEDLSSPISASSGTGAWWAPTSPSPWRPSGPPGKRGAATTTGIRGPRCSSVGIYDQRFHGSGRRDHGPMATGTMCIRGFLWWTLHCPVTVTAMTTGRLVTVVTVTHQCIPHGRKPSECHQTANPADRSAIQGEDDDAFR